MLVSLSMLRFRRRQIFTCCILTFFGCYLAYTTIHLSNPSELRNPNHVNSSSRVEIQNWASPVHYCSQKASDFGCHQRVVSFSLFINDGSAKARRRYIPGIFKNLERMRQFYPGWVMRLYTNDDYILPNINTNSTKDLFVCDVRELPNLATVNDGTVWRFLPILDPTVDVFISRDLDSHIEDREQSAVNQWLKSDKIFHTMRDCISSQVMAGMWGGKNYAMIPEMKLAMVNLFVKNNETDELSDQGILNHILYNPYKDYMMVHDSYMCETMPPTVPFPEQRKIITQFVGQKHFESGSQIVERCPVACRPSYGKNWTYC